MRHGGVSTWLWRSSYSINMSVPRGLRSMRIEHHNVNPVRRIKLEIANCQTVVSSFSFLQEEYLVRLLMRQNVKGLHIRYLHHEYRQHDYRGPSRTMKSSREPSGSQARYTDKPIYLEGILPCGGFGTNAG